MKKFFCGALASALLTITPRLFAQSTASTAAPTNPQATYTYVSQMPSFRGGGADSVLAYIYRNAQYPTEALQAGLSGKVFISFVVNSQGQVEQASVLKGVHPALDQEALRVVSGMPAWQPGKQDGRAVRVAMTLPINFAMPSASKPLVPSPNTSSGAKYPGGPEALLTYLASVPYPEAARAAQTEGRVFIKCRIDATGKVTEARPLAPFQGKQQGKSKPRSINKDISSSMEQAATAWVGNMSGWTPGTKNGALLPSSVVTLPVTFSLTPSTAEKVYPYADRMPVFNTANNPADLEMQIQRAVHYPPQALRNRIQGDVYVYFVVNEAGALESPEIISSPGHGELDDAVLEAVRSQRPAVTPAMQDGKPVKIFYIMPLRFRAL